MQMLDLDPAAQQVVHLLDGTPDDQLASPTPCPDMSVATLLDHFMGLALAFTWAAEKSTPESAGSPSSSADDLDPQWRTVLPRRLDALVAAWREPSAWEGMARAGGVTLPAEVMGAVALDELVMHGWDLARATGQPYECDPVSAEVVLAFAAESARPENAASREGLFGPVVDVPEDAPTFERALGYAGRDPQWVRPG